MVTEHDGKSLKNVSHSLLYNMRLLSASQQILVKRTSNYTNIWLFSAVVIGSDGNKTMNCLFVAYSTKKTLPRKFQTVTLFFLFVYTHETMCQLVSFKV